MGCVQLVTSVIVLLSCYCIHTHAQGCGTATIDLAILVDGSGSICDNDISRTESNGQVNCNNWSLVRSFIANIVSAISVGPGANDARIGLVSFANKGELVFGLTDYSDINLLLDAVNNLPYTGGNTNTSGGIKTMRQELFVAPADRPTAQNVAIIITDGRSTFDSSETIPQAAGAQADGIKMYAVGVTASVDEVELRGLSSDPKVKDQTYFTSTDFEGLQDVLEALLEVTCVTSAPITGCGELSVDLAFVVDASGSICDTSPECIPQGCSGGCENWNRVREFMVDTVNRLSIGVGFSQVSLITFANEGDIVFRFNKYNNKNDVLNALSTAPYTGGNTNTSGGIWLMHTDLFSAQSGDRPTATNLALIITDGKSTMDPGRTVPEAVIARSKGIVIYSVGITNSISETELRAMSSLPQVLDQNYFTSADFDGLSKVLDALLSVACETATPAPTTPAPVSGCNNAADLVLIVDSSGSIREDNFARIKSWIESFINVLAVDQGLTRVGLVTFGDSETLRWNLDRYNTRADLIEAVRNLPYSHGTTNTGSALRFVVDRMFDGFDGDRNGVADIALVLTDGGSNEKQRTWDEALRAKTLGMHIITVGMGDWIDRYELRAISSHPYTKNLLEVENYDNLFSISTDLRNKVCNNVNECASNPCNNGGRCVDGIGSFSCVCTSPYGGRNCQYNINECASNPCRNGGQCQDGIEMFFCICPDNYGGARCEYRCNDPADVVFALDASGSITKENFQYVVDFTKAVIMELPVDTGTRVGLVTYGDSETVYFQLKDYNDRKNLMEALTIPFFRGGSTNTASVLSVMRDNMFTSFEGDNSNAPNVGVLITDGRSNDMEQTWMQAMNNRRSNVEMLAIGVGDSIRQFELDSIASWPINNNVYTINNFENLPSITGQVRDAICNANNECNSNPCRNGGTCRDVRQGFYCECLTGFTGKLCERNCPGSADVAIILDKSGSIRWERFEEVKAFLCNILKELEVWNDKVRVALVSFHDDAELHFGLTTYNHIQDIIHAIMKVAFGGGRTNIAAALDIVRNQVYRSDQGDRLDSPNIVLFFTDGSANIRETETIPTAINMKIDGAHILTMAVGKDLNMMELRGISSSPTSDNLMAVDSFTRLQTLLDPVIDRTCNDVDECNSNPCRNGAQCVDDYDMYHCICAAQFTGVNCDRTCRRQYDVAFLLDFSGSVDNVYTIILSYVERIMYGLEFRRDQVRAALITFDDEAELHFRLDTYQDIRDYLTALAFSRAGGRTNTQDALRLAREEVFQSFFGDRNGVPNIVILLTDGGSNVNDNLTPARAADLKNEGVNIHVVAIGDQIDLGEVNQIASGITEPYVYQIDNESEVANTADRMLAALCQ